jgi:activating signal cointegrator complex subunit 3
MSVCAQCAKTAPGRADPGNQQFYCNDCWKSYDTERRPKAGESGGGFYKAEAESQGAGPSAVLFDIFQKGTAKLSRGNRAPAPRRAGLRELPSAAGPSLAAAYLHSVEPFPVPSFGGGLSPRAGEGSARIDRVAAMRDDCGLTSSVAMRLAMTPEDIVSQIYVHFDEEMTRAIINALDAVALAETADLASRQREKQMNELVELLGTGHLFLLGAALENAKAVLVRLLEEFVGEASGGIDTTTAKHNANVATFGTGVRFVSRGNSAGSATVSTSEKWLQRMARRHKQLTEESELDALFRADLSTVTQSNLAGNITTMRTATHLLVHVPPPERHLLPQSERICIATELPQWAQPSFGEITHLNTLQTKVFDAAFHSSQNLLICAPTGAGKTLVALLVMLRLMQEHMTGGKLDRDFKIIYVAPMKALASEMVTNFQRRLKSYLLAVREFTGDMQLTKHEIAETNVIVTTPEKWDVVTRKQGENDLVRKAKLIIIDEVHLLNDDRGPVIEAIVARTLRTQDMQMAGGGDGRTGRVRIVGLSATLPNFKDVAQFLHADLETGLKVFGPEYRPVPLEQTYLGVPDGGREKEQHLDRLAYDTVLDNVRQGHQVMVFVHSRKQTVTLAKFFRETSQKRHHAHHFTNGELSAQTKARGSKFQGKDLAMLFAAGFGCHNAGLIRFDRNLCEEMFRDGHIRVLFCTATLAWGVNLPAHTVVIRGTEIYDAKRGGMVSLSVLDVMQIFGRAGRPQYDTSGHGIIISAEREIHQYLRLMSHALPIESRLQSRLCDHLNAEVTAGTVTSIAEGVQWLEYTYMWRRIRANPLAYGLTIADVRKDPELRAVRYDTLSRAAVALNDACMVRYNPDTGSLDTTDLGRIASHYYIDHESMRTFNEIMRNPDGTFLDHIDFGHALNIIASANEFSQIRCRMDELDELNKIHEKLPKRFQKIRIVAEAADETSVQWKVTTLIKAYIARLFIDTHSLASDLNYIIQNSSRVCRALFEMETIRAHPATSQVFLSVGKCIERRVWETDHPLMQFNYDYPDAVLARLQERKPKMSLLAEMTDKELGSLVHNQRVGASIAALVRFFPNVELHAEIQPVTRTVLRVKATITPAFTWSDAYHGGVEAMWLYVTDSTNNFIFHHEQVMLKRKDVTQKTPVVVNLTIPIVSEYDMYSIRLVSDRWLQCEEDYVFSISHLHLPDDAPPTTKLLPLAPLGKDVVPEKYHCIFTGFTQFNAVQSQVFHALHHTDSNVFLGAPTGSGKTISAELAMVRLFERQPGAKVVYIAPLKALVKERMKDWRARFVDKLGFKLVELSGDVTPDIGALTTADILCTTPEKWDGISRNWQVRGYVTSVQLVIFDEIHMLGSDRGPILEVIVSRMRYIGWHRKRPIRLVGLSTAVANPGDLASWLGVDRRWALFNFEPSVRPVPMRCHIAGYPGRHYCPRMATMNKPVYNAIVEKSPTKPVIVFVSSRRQTRLTAMALINFLLLENNTAKFVRMTAEEIVHTQGLIGDPHLKHCVQFGIGMHHAGLTEGDRTVIEDLFRSARLQILIATSTLAWGVNFPAHLVIVKGTEFYDGKTKSYVDFPITDVLQMIGRAGRPQYDTEGVAQVLCHEPKKSFYRKFLYDPFPVESSLHKQLHAHINAEIVSGTISTRQDAVDYLTWTYLFRRLVKNPSYYGVEDPSPKALTVFLSNLINKILYDLEQSGCIEGPDPADEDEDPNALKYTVLGRICSYYYLSHLTAQLFDARVNADSAHVDLLKVVCEAQEFAELPVRHNEDKMNLELARSVPLPIDARNAESPHVKAYLLFQAHYARAALPISDYNTDQKSAIDNSIRVIQALVDVTANNGHLHAALRAMTLMQCMVQARWWNDHTLLQLPHVTHAMLAAFEQAGISHIGQIANGTVQTIRRARGVMAQPQFGLTDAHVEEAAYAMQRLPLVDVKVSLARQRSSQMELEEGEAPYIVPASVAEEDDPTTFTVTVELTRLSTQCKYVVAPKFSKSKDEQYWIAVGNEMTGELVALKRVNRLWRRTTVDLVFDWDNEWLEAMGDTQRAAVPLQLYVVCDSFLGLDQQYGFEVVPLGKV